MKTKIVISSVLLMIVLMTTVITRGPLRQPYPIHHGLLRACPDADECPQRPIKGICDRQLKYTTNMEVNSVDDAQEAFQKYTTYMKANDLQDENLGVEWEFRKAEYAGHYQDLAHWIVTFSYISRGGDRGSAQVYVNSKGEVISLLSCI